MSKPTGEAPSHRDALQRRARTLLARSRNALQEARAFVSHAAARFGRDGCSLMAAAIAFYGMISLIPLGVLAISVLGRVLGSAAADHAERVMSNLLRSLVPLRASATEEAIRQFPRATGSWFVETVSLLGLLWAGSRLLNTLEDVLTRVWSGHGRGRPLFMRNVIALAATSGAALIFLAAMVATAAVASLAGSAPGLMAQSALRYVQPWLGYLLPITYAWLMFALTYKFLPQEHVRWRTAALGAATAAIMWEASRIAFAVMVSRSASYGSLYGSLAGAVLLSVWIYVTATIMLIGAEVAVVLHEREQAEVG